MTDPFPEDGSEFGGTGGLIQPLPHPLSAVEQLWVNRRVPSDKQDVTPEQVEEELRGGSA